MADANSIGSYVTLKYNFHNLHYFKLWNLYYVLKCTRVKSFWSCWTWFGIVGFMKS
jgi:hypothetical protein